MWLHFVSRRLVVMELADISNLNPCEAAFRIRLFDRTSKFTDETSPERFNGFSLNLILQIFDKICRHILILVIIGQQYRPLYMKTYTPLPHARYGALTMETVRTSETSACFQGVKSQKLSFSRTVFAVNHR